MGVCVWRLCEFLPVFLLCGVAGWHFVVNQQLLVPFDHCSAPANGCWAPVSPPGPSAEEPSEKQAQLFSPRCVHMMCLEDMFISCV